jgi:hypothetical protein
LPIYPNFAHLEVFSLHILYYIYFS